MKSIFVEAITTDGEDVEAYYVTIKIHRTLEDVLSYYIINIMDRNSTATTFLQ